MKNPTDLLVKDKAPLQGTRNLGIDFLRVVAAIWVVINHAGRDPYLIAISRFAIPVFFMITGYYLLQNKRILKQVQKILFYIIWSGVLYFFINLTPLKAYLSFRQNYIWEIFVLDQSPFALHLWYLQALIKVLLVAWIIKKFSWEWLYKFFPLLLLPLLLLSNYAFLIGRTPAKMDLTCNALALGFPWFAIGWLLEHYKDYTERISNNKLLLVCATSFLTLLLETFFLLNNNQLATKEMYFSLPFFAISLFLLLQRYEIPLDRHIINRLAAMTPFVYILHMIFIKMHRVLKLPPDIRILFVLICSILAAAIITTILAWKRK